VGIERASNFDCEHFLGVPMQRLQAEERRALYFLSDDDDDDGPAMLEVLSGSQARSSAAAYSGVLASAALPLPPQKKKAVHAEEPARPASQRLCICMCCTVLCCWCHVACSTVDSGTAV